MAQSNSGQQSREVAKRVFAREFNNGKHMFKESDGEFAPKYQLLPTGEKANRVFFVGTVTEIDEVGDENTLRARIVDPTGTFVIYAGQYAPEPQTVLNDLTPPSYVAVTGKPRTFEGDESGEIYATIRPETITEVSNDVRDQWVAETARRTLERIDQYDDADEYNDMAREHYDHDTGRYVDTVVDALTDEDSGLGATGDSSTADSIGTSNESSSDDSDRGSAGGEMSGESSLAGSESSVDGDGVDDGDDSVEESSTAGNSGI
jgi:RPA family protein